MADTTGHPSPEEDGSRPPRLPPLPRERWDAEVMDALEEGRSALLAVELQQALDSKDRDRLASVLPNGITTLLYNPGLSGAWLAFNGTLLRELTLSARHRELIVLRVAWRTRSTYEWRQHVRMAPRYQIGEDEVERIATARCDGPWDALDDDLLAATDQLLDRHTIDGPTWGRLAARLDKRELVELPFVVGAYATLAMAFNSFAIELDPQYRTVTAPPIPQTEV